MIHKIEIGFDGGDVPSTNNCAYPLESRLRNAEIIFLLYACMCAQTNETRNAKNDPYDIKNDPSSVSHFIMAMREARSAVLPI